MSATLRTVLLRVISVVRFIVNIVATLCALVLLALFALEFVRGGAIASSPLVAKMHYFADPLIRRVSSLFGMHWPSKSINAVPLGIAVVVWILKGLIDGLLQRADFRVRTVFKEKIKRAGLQSLEEDDGSAAMGSKLKAETEQHREVLLKRQREIEEALKTAGRKHCTFLSMDVVGSTQMKIGESETAIAATFQAYEELVRSTFESCSVWKQTWTPDGVMACFLDRDLAVSAAQRILSELQVFNRSKSQLRTPFKVRCGLNDGDVSIFEDSQLEKIADHSIDVAGHMQKHASEDSLWVSDEVYQTLGNKSGFKPTGVQVDGFAAIEWRPHPVTAPAS
jgi:class 3 adenylate cyclase